MRLAFHPSGALAYEVIAGAARTLARGHRAADVRPSLGAMTEAEYAELMRQQAAQNQPGTNWGDVATGAAITGTFAGVQQALRSGSLTQGGIVAGLSAAAMIPGPQQPFIAAAAALISPILTIFRGCGQTCVLATRYVDQWDRESQQLVRDYFAQPVRTRSMQLVVLAALRAGQEELVRNCSNPQLGQAGQRCVAFHAEQNAGMVQADWCDRSRSEAADPPFGTHYANVLGLPAGYGCDFWTATYGRVAADPEVVDDAPVSQAGNTQPSSGSALPLLLGAGALAAAAFLMAGAE